MIPFFGCVIGSGCLLLFFFERETRHSGNKRKRLFLVVSLTFRMFLIHSRYSKLGEEELLQTRLGPQGNLAHKGGPHNKYPAAL